jgi:hypothetical protein
MENNNSSNKTNQTVADVLAGTDDPWTFGVIKVVAYSYVIGTIASVIKVLKKAPK